MGHTSFSRSNMQRNVAMFSFALLVLVAITLQSAESADSSTCSTSMSVLKKELKAKLGKTFFEYRCMIRKLIVERLSKDQLGENLIDAFDIALNRINTAFGPYVKLLGSL
ncbi:hypothetical protein FGIG_00229 [Fasciola gigantica]|uniref:Uncharacterized protein n=1 Tax=Fasciola gigantica TaxID=46835 RepID=A0A504Z4T9_FASGI|nr:hypothetical protein FGIG_00229 [Fasciola gigantica]